MASPRRLLEVDFPIAEVSEQAVAERHASPGHIRSSHIWWARKPLASTRTIALAALLPDPDDPACPASFRAEADRILTRFGIGPFKGTLRERLSLFLAELSAFAHATHPHFLEASRSLVRAAFPTAPILVDPFAGGGSHPLEALRLGAEAVASDLNPVSTLLVKALLELAPRHGETLIVELEAAVTRVATEAERRLQPAFAGASSHERVVAYLWGRTVRCEGPSCGVAFPVVGETVLSKKHGPRTGFQWRREGDEVVTEVTTGDAKTEFLRPTYARGKATCPVCGFASRDAMKRQGQEGRLGHRMLAVLAQEGPRGKRLFRNPTGTDLASFAEARRCLADLRRHGPGELPVAPDEPFPIHDTRAFTPGLYGIRTWGDLFSERQTLVLATYASLIREEGRHLTDPDLARAVRVCLAIVLDKVADNLSMLCSFGTDYTAHSFVRAAVPVVFYYTEFHPFQSAQASLKKKAHDLVEVLRHVQGSTTGPASVHLCEAARLPLPDASVHLVFTDPPYFDAIPYADLSDFFYVWLKRSVGPEYPDLFQRTLTPKDEEILVNEVSERGGRTPKDSETFSRMMVSALSEARRVVAEDGLLVLVFAHKSTEGWEAVLEGILRAGWTITASWPVETEMPTRLRAMRSAALASSIYLVCRPRGAPGTIGDWREVQAELVGRIDAWLPRLAREGIVGADAIFACLGPALEVFSCHERVEKASGEVVALHDFLERVWAAVADAALSMIFSAADARGFEEDARLTAMWLWTLSAAQAQQPEGVEETDEEDDEAPGEKAKSAGFVLEFDAARKIAQGLGVHLESLTSLVELKGETARLLPVADRKRSLFATEPSAPRRTPKSKARQALLKFAAEVQDADDGPQGRDSTPARGATILDRLHQAMLLFAGGRTEALRRFLVEDGVGQDDRFWRLAQALSALYPAGTDEKRWVDGVLARKKGAGV